MHSFGRFGLFGWRLVCLDFIELVLLCGWLIVIGIVVFIVMEFRVATASPEKKRTAVIGLL